MNDHNTTTHANKNNTNTMFRLRLVIRRIIVLLTIRILRIVQLINISLMTIIIIGLIRIRATTYYKPTTHATHNTDSTTDSHKTMNEQYEYGYSVE